MGEPRSSTTTTSEGGASSHPSVVAPGVARRHFVRWVLGRPRLSSRAARRRDIFDTLRIHTRTYTLCFLSNQMWDRLVDDLAPSDSLRGCTGWDSVAVGHALRRVGGGASDGRLSADSLSDLVLSVDDDDDLVALFRILYASSQRRERIRQEKERRRSEEERRRSQGGSVELAECPPGADAAGACAASARASGSTNDDDTGDPAARAIAVAAPAPPGGGGGGRGGGRAPRGVAAGRARAWVAGLLWSACCACCCKGDTGVMGPGASHRPRVDAGRFETTSE